MISEREKHVHYVPPLSIEINKFNFPKFLSPVQLHYEYNILQNFKAMAQKLWDEIGGQTNYPYYPYEILKFLSSIISYFNIFFYRIQTLLAPTSSVG